MLYLHSAILGSNDALLKGRRFYRSNDYKGQDELSHSDRCTHLSLYSYCSVGCNLYSFTITLSTASRCLSGKNSLHRVSARVEGWNRCGILDQDGEAPAAHLQAHWPVEPRTDPLPALSSKFTSASEVPVLLLCRLRKRTHLQMGEGFKVWTKKSFLVNRYINFVIFSGMHKS